MWRSRVCHQVYLCAGRLFATLVTVGALNMLLFFGSFGALSTQLYAAPSAPLLCASHCAPVLLVAPRACMLLRLSQAIVVASLLSFLLVLPQDLRWHRPRPAAHHPRLGQARSSDADKVAGACRRLEDCAAARSPAPLCRTARRRAAGGRHPRCSRHRSTPRKGMLSGRSSPPARSAVEFAESVSV